MGEEYNGRCSMSGREHVEGMWTMWRRKHRHRGILAALVIPRIMGRTDDAKRTAAKVQIRNIEGALQLYKLDNGVYPSTEQGLKALVEKPSVGVIPKKWKLGGYLPKLPEDPWANPYKYLSPSPKGDYEGEYEIISLGTDGEVGGEGINADITNWNLD